MQRVGRESSGGVEESERSSGDKLKEIRRHNALYEKRTTLYQFTAGLSVFNPCFRYRVRK